MTLLKKMGFINCNEAQTYQWLCQRDKNYVLTIKP